MAAFNQKVNMNLYHCWIVEGDVAKRACDRGYSHASGSAGSDSTAGVGARADLPIGLIATGHIPPERSSASDRRNRLRTGLYAMHKGRSLHSELPDFQRERGLSMSRFIDGQLCSDESEVMNVSEGSTPEIQKCG